METFDPKTAPGYVFQPQPDITVAELAYVLQTVLNFQDSVFVPELVKQIPETCARHFVDRREVELKKMIYLGASKV
jgi:hypothetical protein